MKYLLIILLFACQDAPKNNGGGKPPVTVNPPVDKPVDIPLPENLLNWQDRRPIGMIMLASYTEPYSPGKRNWKLGGQMQFSKKALYNHLNESIKNAKAINAQGVIIWDIEGQEYPHAYSYIGDPTKVPEEMDTLSNEIFQLIRDSGLAVGLCLRPDSIVYKDGWIFHYNVSDPFYNISEKVKYAKARWGCTLFYVDSNVGEGQPVNTDNTAGYGRLISFTVFQRLAETFPDCLFLPEHQDNYYYKFTAPYNDKNYRHYLTPDEKGFQVLMADGFTLDQLTESVKQGNVLMGRVWYPSPELQLIKQAYESISKRD